jgi:uncharacterized membrane protein
MVQTLDEVAMLGAIVILRVILTYVIHWEIQSHENKKMSRPVASSPSQ